MAETNLDVTFDALFLVAVSRSRDFLSIDGVRRPRRGRLEGDKFSSRLEAGLVGEDLLFPLFDAAERFSPFLSTSSTRLLRDDDLKISGDDLRIPSRSFTEIRCFVVVATCFSAGIGFRSFVVVTTDF
jgi:hypothetical protein